MLLHCCVVALSRCRCLVACPALVVLVFSLIILPGLSPLFPLFELDLSFFPLFQSSPNRLTSLSSFPLNPVFFSILPHVRWAPFLLPPPAVWVSFHLPSLRGSISSSPPMDSLSSPPPPLWAPFHSPPPPHGPFSSFPTYVLVPRFIFLLALKG